MNNQTNGIQRIIEIDEKLRNVNCNSHFKATALKINSDNNI